MENFRVILTLVFVQVIATTSFGQVVYKLYSDSSNKLLNRWEKQLNREQPSDPLGTLQLYLYDQGYLLSTISADTSNSYFNLKVNFNKQYNWANIDFDRRDIGLISQYLFRSFQIQDEPVSPKELSKLMTSLLKELENSGYPFASVRLDSTSINKTTVSAKLKIEKGPPITIDSIRLTGSTNISHKYIYNYLQIKPGDPYNEKLIRDIPVRVNELAFLAQSKPAEVVFAKDGTSLILNLNKKKANDFNGIIGFQPNEETGDIVITGDIHLKLISPLGKGEKLNLQWRRLQSQTQDIRVELNLPYLLNTPLGIDAGLQIYRRDTSFSTITFKGGLQYALKGGDYVELNIQNEQSNLISTVQFENNTTLPDVADITFLHYGLELHSSRLDYQLNPRKGYRFTISGSFGEKQIRENPNLTLIDYDSLNLSTTQFKIKGAIQAFVPILKKAAIQFQLNGGHLDNETLFRNELFRIGGLQSIRGFDEESIFASSYLIHRLELRWLLEQNSYTYVFYDQGWYEDVSSESAPSDTPIGIGAGISFQTNAGIFSLNYALGSQFEQGFDYRSGKIHFGFVNYF